MFLRDSALASDAGGPVSSTGSHGLLAVCAEGQASGWTALWERNSLWEYKHFVQSPPYPRSEHGYRRGESGDESVHVVCKEAEHSARRRISTSKG
jgi:hypothetical protein